MPPRAGGSPQFQARICGVLYLYVIAAGTFAQLFVRGRLVVPSDAEATAARVMAHETLFRAGFAAEFLHLACDVGVAVILYALFRARDRNLSLVAAFMRLACLLILAVTGLTQFAALRLWRGADYLAVLEPGQRNALALLALRLHGDGYAVALVFFGFACLALGALIVRSARVPRAIGVLLVLAGGCYLLNSFTHFLAPALAGRLSTLFVVPFVAELALALWLVVRGVRPDPPDGTAA